MKLYHYFYLLAICTYVMGSSCCAMTEEPKEQQTYIIIQQNDALDKQLEDIQPFIEENKSKSNPLCMALGVHNKERNLDQHFPESGWIFVDQFIDPQYKGRPGIKANFNDLPSLQKIATKFKGLFERIVLDDSTFKFTEWTVDIIQEFSHMLRSGGQFIFPLQFSTGTSTEVKVLSNETEIMTLLKQSNLWNGTELPKAYWVPLIKPSDEEINGTDTENIINSRAYKGLRDFLSGYPKEIFNTLFSSGSSPAYKEYRLKAKELDVKTPPNPLMLMGDPNVLKRTIARKLKTERVFAQFEEETVYPYCKTLLEKVFFHVKFESNVPFVIPSNYNQTASLLVTCTKQ